MRLLYGHEVDDEVRFSDLLQDVELRREQIPFGYKPDPDDHRDLTVEKVEDAVQAKVFTARPAQELGLVDYEDQQTSVRDQDFEGTCVGFSVSAMKEFQEKVERITWAFSASAIKTIAPRFIYFKAREPYGWDNATDQGAYIRDGFKVLYNLGAVIESGWPYVVNDWTSTPNPMRVADSPRYKITSYVRLQTPEEMVQWLHQAGNFVAGIDTFRGIFDPYNGVVPMPADDDYAYGGHAICVCGYDPEGYGLHSGPLFKFKNSWSEAWGQGGYGYLPAEYLRDHSSDNWGSLDLLTVKPRVT